ncbi:similar to Saccharomyces cerevisiae YGR020C VMA7 Subunit F of the eight-subunit V1 peripheral membrane domain of vacuolar H+-ATPase (V- ATPase) [Maudiozyma barnettii]|uniref:V-type proton ATPase subunit F n=2 Tax=Maudiozyma TaxID=3162980 RepID=A0A1X7RAK0_9SACH|nr:H(+)-transporting V1 sector ATPase subunit F [Kazachstania barnettii]CAB4256768.1 similar to Saccharomyces cerevisiae YGR020C VMA7 Subunit F of the eight-subunit V1 peripheral membrane domain of vacuolar H+-ATPase (V- ATPase) [Kazachstania barnettii]CAD1785421.1 similar to Saccharomyces cerevisiae YGR020C VMA7 Subunit F of the eight-subunit V1 peripheral membrane domain of vacuolar H+-ATPase (V- ATPase) [Kazachstania barnettii]SMN22489.1 similar to Saccharomyces cerevisiae YGR020C VMA7 Subuni
MSDKRTLIAVMGDEDTTTGLLLAGIGQIDPKTNDKNFFVYKENKTTKEQLEMEFNQFTQERKDVAILLINQFVADMIRSTVDSYVEPFPAILEIPSKDHPYDPEKDSVLKRVRKLFGE